MKQSSLDIINDLLRSSPRLEPCRADITAAVCTLIECYNGGGMLLICGNGGSAADSGHIVGELMKEFRVKRPVPPEIREALRAADPQTADYLADHLQCALPAISLADHTALITAFVNDAAADMVFAQQVFGYGKGGDCLLGISTSGNSANVVNALKVAKALNIHTIGMTGASGGKMGGVCDINISVPAVETYLIQEMHLPIYHALCAMVEAEFWGAA